MTTYTLTFTTSKAFDSGGQCPCAIWPDTPPSGVTDASDTSSVELGVRFQATQNGTISGVRFYKEPDNTGTHTGTLWTASGTELATGTFSNESSQGWEELDFSSPVTVTAGTTYVASYHTSSGHYAVTSGGLNSAVTNGPLTALANGGVYAYGSSTIFPTNTFSGSNYWVDVVYQPDLSPPTVTATTPGNSATSVPVSTAVTATFNKAIKSGSATFTAHWPGREHGSWNDVARQHRDRPDVHSVQRAQPGHHLPGERQRRDQHVRCRDDVPGYLVVHYFRIDSVSLHDLGERCHAGYPVGKRLQLSGAGSQIPGHYQRLDLRRPVLQGFGEHRHPYRKPVDGHRCAARPWHFYQRDCQRLADAGVPHGRARQHRTDLCR